MKPYGVAVIEWPDRADVSFNARKSRMGKLRSGPKRRTRRLWKKRARASAAEMIRIWRMES